MSDDAFFDNLDLTDDDLSGIPSVEDEKPVVSPPKELRKAASRLPAGEPSNMSEGRVPLHRRHTVKSTQRPGFVRRVFNNKPGRIDDGIRASWRPVQDDSKIGDPKTGLPSSMGSAQYALFETTNSGSCGSHVSRVTSSRSSTYSFIGT